MNLSVSGAIKSDPFLGRRVEHASELLEEIIGPTAQAVTVEWSLVHDASNRLLVLLVVADFTGVSVEARFAPEELANEGHLSAKLYRIWGDLLQSRSHKQLDMLSGRVPVGE